MNNEGKQYFDEIPGVNPGRHGTGSQSCHPLTRDRIAGFSGMVSTGECHRRAPSARVCLDGFRDIRAV
jgi:hypothetical protein